MSPLKRCDGRRVGDLRPVTITPNFLGKADGSCLMEMGGTRVICTASFEPGVPDWLVGKGSGWLTAEYGMLPASTARRKSRPGSRPDGRGVEIQRLIGRVLRTAVRKSELGENTVYLDCDVLEADGGTRTASITGAYVALAIALRRAQQQGRIGRRALGPAVAGVSVGLVAGQAMLDLSYVEDSTADVDMNVAMTADGKWVEVQASAESDTFTTEQMDRMLLLARRGIRRLLSMQHEAIERGVT